MNKLDELIKELCPNGVEYKELGEIFNLKNGYTPSKSNSEYWENADVNWFRIEDINTNGGILKNSIQRVNIKGIKGNLFAAKSLIVSTTATIGKHALILKEFKYILEPQIQKNKYIFLTKNQMKKLHLISILFLSLDKIYSS